MLTGEDFDVIQALSELETLGEQEVVGEIEGVEWALIPYSNFKRSSSPEMEEIQEMISKAAAAAIAQASASKSTNSWVEYWRSRR